MSPIFKRPESVLVVVFTGTAQVLLMERREPAGFWQSVTGSLAHGEAPLAAARRELREETGLRGNEHLVDRQQVNRFPILPAWRHRYAPEVEFNTEHVFTLELSTELPITLNPGEHSRCQWMERGAAAKLASSATNREAILAWVPAMAPGL